MRFIHVGVGGFGQVWGERLARDRRAEVVALVDVNKKALNTAREAWGYDKGICFPSLTEALKTVEADALVSSTPPGRHKNDVITALGAGLNVISEKPMADSLASCKAMLRAARETGRTYVVSQNYRYRPETWTLAKMVRGGKLGAIGQIKMDFYMGVNFGGGFRHTMDYPLVVDMSIHHFDLIRFITGLDPVSVTATAWNPPWSNYKGDCSTAAVFEMSNGARALYNGSWCAKGQFCDWNGNWQIECEKGTLVYEKGNITLHKAPDLYRVAASAPVKLTKPRTLGQQFVLNDFIQAVRTGRRAATDVYDNIGSIAMVFATVKAMRTGRKVPVMDAGIRKLLAGRE
ncbi:Gfo/Idh/MocA family protein [Verrucomicrobiota bacterium]